MTEKSLTAEIAQYREAPHLKKRDYNDIDP